MKTILLKLLNTGIDGHFMKMIVKYSTNAKNKIYFWKDLPSPASSPKIIP